jgi:hypothetical protein
MENKNDIFELIESPIKMNEDQFEALWASRRYNLKAIDFDDNERFLSQFTIAKTITVE